MVGNQIKVRNAIQVLGKIGKPLPSRLHVGQVIISKTDLLRMAKIQTYKRSFEPKNRPWAAKKLTVYVKRFGVDLPSQNNRTDILKVVFSLDALLSHETFNNTVEVI